MTLCLQICKKQTMSKTPEQMAEEWANGESDLWYADISTYTDGHKDAINQAFLAGYNAAQPQWISVKERLPELCTQVLIICGLLPFYHIAYLTHNGDIQWFATEDGTEYQLGYVTHWMPLPEAPKEGE